MMSTLSRHLSPDDRRWHLVSLFQSVYWNLLHFSLRFSRSHYRLLGTRFLMLPHQTSQIGTPASLGTFSDCPIVLYHGQVGLDSALLSVGWSCRLPFVVALVHPAAVRILRTAHCSLHFLLPISIWAVDFFKSPSLCMEANGSSTSTFCTT
jgi:hypothetical protein